MLIAHRCIECIAAGTYAATPNKAVNNLEKCVRIIEKYSADEIVLVLLV